MDDLSMFGQKPKTPLEEAWHNEQRRKQYDTIRVHNPTLEDFYVEYDVGRFQKVPANSDIDVPRYIAERYVEHMKDKIINDKAKKMHDDFIEARRLKGLPEYKDKAQENAETYETTEYPKTNDENLVAEIYNTLWVGVVSVFGKDLPPPVNGTQPQTLDMRPQTTRILEGLSNKTVEINKKPIMGNEKPTFTPPASTIPTPPSPFAALNEKLLVDEVTNNE